VFISRALRNVGRDVRRHWRRRRSIMSTQSGNSGSEPSFRAGTRGFSSNRSGRNGAVAALVALSIVIPVHNEAESAPLLADEIDRAFDDRSDWECLWVDDGSDDGTRERLAELHRRDPQHHHYVTLEKRCGQSGALAAGFRMARGRVIATLDGDLQNDPAELPRLIGMLERGRTDMATGVRVVRRDGWVKRASSRTANAFRNWITRDRIQDTGCSLRAFYRECIEDVPVFAGMHRFLPTLVRMNGFVVSEVPVGHRPRPLGKSKYGVNNRLWRGVADCLAVRWMQARRVEPHVCDSSLLPAEEERSHVS
jgi:glycosyltransferase involved in cell wall biosynthesis